MMLVLVANASRSSGSGRFADFCDIEKAHILPLRLGGAVERGGEDSAFGGGLVEHAMSPPHH